MGTKRNYHISDERMETYKKAAEKAEKMSHICNHILHDGMTEAEACRAEDIRPMNFRNFCKFYRNAEAGYDAAKDYKWYSWEEAFLKDLTGEEAIAPEGFSEIYEEAIMTLPSDKERDILNKYYKENLSYRDISDEYGVSHERIRQIMTKSMRRLRMPTTRNFLLYGRNYMEEVMKLDTEQKKYDQVYFEKKKNANRVINSKIEEVRAEKDKYIEMLRNVSHTNNGTIDASLKAMLADRMIKTDISEMNLYKHTEKAIRDYVKKTYGRDYTSVMDVYLMSVWDIENLPRIGIKSVLEISQRLASMFGISFTDKWTSADRNLSGLIA